jgi:gas vesicle protein
MRDSGSKTLFTFLAGLAAGAIAGAIAGILFAPGKGSETRQKIKDKAGSISDELSQKINELKKIIDDRMSSDESRNSQS